MTRSPAAFPYGKLEEPGVQVRRATRRVSLRRTAGIGASAVEERIEFLYAWKAPIVKTSELRLVEFARAA